MIKAIKDLSRVTTTYLIHFMTLCINFLENLTTWMNVDGIFKADLNTISTAANINTLNG